MFNLTNQYFIICRRIAFSRKYFNNRLRNVCTMKYPKRGHLAISSTSRKRHNFTEHFQNCLVKTSIKQKTYFIKELRGNTSASLDPFRTFANNIRISTILNIKLRLIVSVMSSIWNYEFFGRNGGQGFIFSGPANRPAATEVLYAMVFKSKRKGQRGV